MTRSVGSAANYCRNGCGSAVEGNSADGIEQWNTQPELDAWITYESWVKRLLGRWSWSVCPKVTAPTATHLLKSPADQPPKNKHVLSLHFLGPRRHTRFLRSVVGSRRALLANTATKVLLGREVNIPTRQRRISNDKSHRVK